MYKSLHPSNDMCQEKKEEEELPTLKIAFFHQYED